MITIFQPALPTYRVPFFEKLYCLYGDRFQLAVSHASELGDINFTQARPWIRPLPPLAQSSFGLDWQPGALSVAIKKGDAVIVCGAPRTISTLLLILKARILGAKTIWWGHYWSATSQTWRANLRLKLLSLVDGVIFYTDREVVDYSARFAHPETKVFALNNGIDNQSIKTLRAAYDPNNRETDLVFIGRLTDKAKLELLIAALSKPGCTRLKLSVIGDGPLRCDLMQQAERGGVAARINWVGAATDEARIAAIMNASKIFVYPGAVGLSLIHAMNYGLPAIVHNDRWAHMPEIAAFNEPETGATFTSGSADDLARVLALALADRDRLIEQSRASIAVTEVGYNIDGMIRRFEQAIGAIAGQV